MERQTGADSRGMEEGEERWAVFWRGICCFCRANQPWPCVVPASTKAVHGPDKALHCRAVPGSDNKAPCWGLLGQGGALWPGG